MILESDRFDGRPMRVVDDPKLDVLAVESVWDYPRPPRLEVVPQRIRVVHGGRTIADTEGSGEWALRILETSHPPVFYLPRAAVAMEFLEASRSRQSFCEFKGLASYWSVAIPGHVSPDAAWSYEEPSPAYAALGYAWRFMRAGWMSAGWAGSGWCRRLGIFMAVGSLRTCVGRSRGRRGRGTGSGCKVDLGFNSGRSGNGKATRKCNIVSIAALVTFATDATQLRFTGQRHMRVQMTSTGIRTLVMNRNLTQATLEEALRSTGLYSSSEAEAIAARAFDGFETLVREGAGVRL